MQIRVGYELLYDCPQLTPMLLTLRIHPTRVSDILAPDHLITSPSIPITAYRDAFGNWCSRIVAPPGEIRLTADAVVNYKGEPDVIAPWATQHAVQDLPGETLGFLLGSRYCETDLLSQVAWNLFGNSPTGWGRVQAICDFVHHHITFGYEYARATKTACEAFNERTGVCRDYTISPSILPLHEHSGTLLHWLPERHRYATPYSPMDFAAWFEAYLGGQWYTFDPRNNVQRIGRVLIAQGRDAADVAISNTFGPNILKSFKVWTDEVRGEFP